jgi:hypothetical protein
LIFEAKNDKIRVIEMIENTLKSTKEKFNSTLLTDNSRTLIFCSQGCKLLAETRATSLHQVLASL